MTNIRPQVAAGSFYPEDEKELKSQIENYLKSVKKIDFKGSIKAVISPHAGYIYSGPVAAYSYKTIIKKNFREVIIIGLSHQMMFQGIALSNFSFWKTPLGNVPSSSLYKKLEDENSFKLLNEAHVFEHSIEVELPFLQTVIGSFLITPMLTGRINNHKEIAEIISRYIHEKTLIVVSSDLLHYLPYEEANKIDKETIEKILNFDTDIEHERACGADGIIILLELARLLNWKVKLLDYRNSGDTCGDKSQVVGYASIVFTK
jgi:AmmeMemoRadiSam system protein B